MKKRPDSKLMLILAAIMSVLTAVTVVLGVLGRLPFLKKKPIQRTFRNNDRLYRGR